MNGIEVRAALTLALVYVLRMLGLFMVMPVLALTAQDFADYSVVWVGIAIGGYGLTQALLQIPMGMLSDKWGRKPVILLGLGVFAMGSIVAALADTMLWLTLGRILQGAGAIAGAIMALATDVSREQHRAKVMAIIGIAIGFSFYLAVILGPAIASVWGLAGVFGITGILALLCLPLVKWAVPDSPQQFSGETTPRFEHVVQLLRTPALWRLNLSVMLLHMLITLMFVQLPVSLLAVNIPLVEQNTFYIPVLLLSLVLLAVIMRASKGKAPRWVLLTSLAMLGIAFTTLFNAPQNYWTLVVTMVIFFTGFNYLEANFPAILATLAPPGKKGTAMGIYASHQFFGAFLGGVLSGAVSQRWGPSASYLCGVVIVLLWSVVLYGLRIDEKLKRVAIRLSPEQSPSAEQLASLHQFNGVADAVYAPEQHTLYLKVSGDFAEIEARSAIDAW